MKSIYITIFALVTIFLSISGAQAQMIAPQDTTLGNTETAAKTAAWVRDIVLPTGKGGIGALSGMSAQALIADTSRKYINNTSMQTYYSGALYQTDLQNIRNKVLQRIVLMRRLGVLAARDPALFSWGVLEPVKGTYNFTLMDSLIKVGGEYGVPFVGTIVPFSDWASSCNADRTMFCNNLFGSDNGADYFFINQGKIGPVCDTAAFYAFVQKLVERYDGDGIDDMPGLKAPVTYWEFSNEPDGACGGYGDQKYADGRQPNSAPGQYSRDHSIMFRAVKAACPSCQVMNGGAIESNDVRFWNNVLDTLAPSKRYLDIANIHVNTGKTTKSSDWDWGNNFYRYVSIFQNKINQYSVKTPMWMTEWGFYSGTPIINVAPGQTTTLPNRTEEEYTAIHAKFYLWGKANNLTTFFYDFSGGVGGWGAALIQTGAGGNKAMLLYHTLRLYEYKFRDADSARQISFSTSGNLSLPSGHIRFFKRGVASDVVWGLTALPASIAGRKVRTDMYGNTDTHWMQPRLRFLGSNPIILENAPTMSSVAASPSLVAFDVSPNPSSDVVRVNFTLLKPERVQLKLYNVLGVEVASLLDDEFIAGDHSFHFSTTSIAFSSQMLFVQLKTQSSAFKTLPLQVLR